MLGKLLGPPGCVSLYVKLAVSFLTGSRGIQSWIRSVHVSTARAVCCLCFSLWPWVHVGLAAGGACPVSLLGTGKQPVGCYVSKIGFAECSLPG